MDGIISGLAAALALVLISAGVAKLRRPAETEASFAELGLPAPTVLARLVPFAEIGVAIGLVVVPGWSALVAFAMLAAFTVVLVVALRSPAPKSCACFGVASERPVSPLDISRNLLLMAVAAAVVTLDSWVAPSAGQWLAVAGLVALFWLVGRVARESFNFA